MARIQGVDIPDDKRGEIALTYIYGIGKTTARDVLEKAKVDYNKKVAEQLAAKVLLENLSSREQGIAAVAVDDARQAVLEQQNPKGKLLEFCAQHKLPTPRFKVEAVVNGFRCVATISLDGRDILETQPFQAGRAKVAEQAAAAALYQQIRSSTSSRPHQASRSQPPPADQLPKRPDARMQLNEWRQTKHLAGFGYELVDHQGPSHQPIFVMTAWAELPGGNRCTTNPITAGSKKEAQIAAADALRTLLEADTHFTTGLLSKPSSS